MSTLHLKTAALAAGILLAGACVAGAATITHTIKLSGYGGQNDAFTYSAGNIDLTVTGHLLNLDGTIGSQESVGQWSNGLGVLNNDEMRRYCRYFRSGKRSCSSYSSDQHFVDGSGQDEVLKFQFSQAVQIEQVWFTYVDRDDDFAFSVIDEDVSAHSSQHDIPGSGSGRGYSVKSYQFGDASYISDVFGIGARGSNDQFKVRQIKFSYDDTPVLQVFSNDIPENLRLVSTPLPAGAVLLLSALGGLAAARRRRG